MSAEEQYRMFFDGLKQYLPLESVPQICRWLVEYDVYLKISKARMTKWGDYRPPFKDKGHRISINYNLNPYAFLTVMVHELAHLVTYKEYGRNHQPHGKEWKQIYRQMMTVFLGRGIYPPDVEAAVQLSLQKIKGCVDPALQKVFRKYDPDKGTKMVSELPPNTCFKLNKSFFRKIRKVRTRYICTNLVNGKDYTVSGSAEVYVIKDPELQ